jgi:hypothetical protein
MLLTLDPAVLDTLYSYTGYPIPLYYLPYTPILLTLYSYTTYPIYPKRATLYPSLLDTLCLYTTYPILLDLLTLCSLY